MPLKYEAVASSVAAGIKAYGGKVTLAHLADGEDLKNTLVKRLEKLDLVPQEQKIAKKRFNACLDDYRKSLPMSEEEVEAEAMANEALQEAADLKTERAAEAAARMASTPAPVPTAKALPAGAIPLTEYMTQLIAGRLEEMNAAAIA